jgi:hypothetical protein
MLRKKIRFAGSVVTCCLASWCYQSSAQPAAPSGLDKDAMPTNVTSPGKRLDKEPMPTKLTGPGKRLDDRGIGNPRGKEIQIEGGGKLIQFDLEGKNPKTRKEWAEVLQEASRKVSKIDEGCTGCDKPKIYLIFTPKQLGALVDCVSKPDGTCK